MMLLGLTLLGSAAAAPVANTRSPFDSRPESFRHYWEFSGTDCYPGIELGNCSDSHPPPYSIQECKAACLAMPNCGGFNLPNGHLKKLGCMEEMQPWVDPPHSHRLDLYVLNEYAPQRNYWWRVTEFDCNPGIELGDCAEHPPPYSDAECKETCLANPECAAYKQPHGHLKAMDCRQDLIDSANWTRPQTLFVALQQPEPRKPGIPLEFTPMAATDCNPGRELGNCSTYLPPPYTVSECEAACRNNPLCAGFNLPNGHMKTVDCDQDIRTGSSQDLYLIRGASPTSKQLP